MAGDSLTGVGPFARQGADGSIGTRKPVVDLDALKAELRARLTHPDHGGISNLRSFIAAASGLPLYSISRPLTRFLLLAAYHDAVESSVEPGLIDDGKVGVAPCFTSDGWFDDGHFTIEHIAPQQATGGWDSPFYSDKDIVNRLGNLVLSPGNANSSLSSRPWTEKKVLYAALGAKSVEEARTVLVESGLIFNQTTEELVQMSHYLPHLRALGQRSADWDPAFMESRTEVLLRRVYSRLQDWLGLEWEETGKPIMLRDESNEGEDDLDFDEQEVD